MLTAAVDSYLAARRAVGFQLRDTEDILRDFVAFASGNGDPHVCSRTVLDWIRSRSGSPLRKCVRLRTVALLARYLHAEDERHEIPPQDAFGRHRAQRRPPFLFTPEDVAALICAARRLGPDRSLQPHVYGTLFGLLASTGLRISEALNLRIEDVTPQGLIVRNTKFGKSRMLPLHTTTRERIESYLERRLREAGVCPFVFVSIRGRKLHRNTVGGVFRRLVFSLGVAERENKLRPRLHDLRFYFANQVLTHSPGDHEGIDRHMVALTTYLGHSDVRNGYWYLGGDSRTLRQNRGSLRGLCQWRELMTPLAPLVTAFFRKNLAAEKGVSKNTIASYSYTFKFLCRYVSDRLGKAPSALQLEDLDARIIRDFLEYLERECSNTPRTRNLRLTAIRSFMKYVEYEAPAALDQVRQVRALSNKRTQERLVNHLNREEMKAVLDVPNPSTRKGVRDQAMLYLGFAAGLRVSELVGLRLDEIELDGPYPSILVQGKGRKQRRLPLWKEATRALRAWLALRGTVPTSEVFLNTRGEALTPSGFRYVVKSYVRTASSKCPSLSKKHVSPHVLRHTCAMTTLQATKDIRKVALWLGHSSLKSTEIYLRADPTEKLEAIEKALPPELRRGIFQVEDKLIAWLAGQKLCGVNPWDDGTK